MYLRYVNILALSTRPCTKLTKHDYDDLTNHEPMENRPSTPLESDCCGNGCNPCIFDAHQKLIEDWEKRKLLLEPHAITNNLLTQTKYKSFTISDSKQACANCIFIRLQYEDGNATLHLNPGQHVILRSMSSTRPYTPISWTNNSFLILVKIYSDGKFSRSLANMEVGDHIDVRGPYGDFIYKSNSFENILLLSIGTGIAALYPIAKSIIDNELEETRVHLIAGFKSLSHVPLQTDLRNLSHYWNFSCTIKLSEPDGHDVLNGVKLENGHLEKDSVATFLRSRSATSTLVLICGTPEFNKAALQWIADLNFTNFWVFD